jgi:uncharacterized membrane protein
MKTRFVLISVLTVGILMLAISYLLVPSMGPNLAIHWNAEGVADSYGTPFTALYLIPLMTMALSIMLMFIPGIDPLKVNIATFRSQYNVFVIFFAGFMYYVHGLSLAWNLGLRFSMNAMLAPAMGLFFIIAGMLLLKAKRNYFIGIRTPWTLASDIVWEKTHQMGGRLFIASGVLTLACILYPSATPFVLLVTAIGSALISIVYSYLEFRKIEKRTPTG